MKVPFFSVKHQTPKKSANSLRRHNRDLMISVYRDRDRASIADITGKTSLSRTTVMKINSDLLKEGVIIEAGKGDSTEVGGKKPVLYRFNARLKLVLTFHIKYDQIHFRISDLSYQSIVKDEIGIPLNSPFPYIAGQMNVLLTKHLEGKLSKKSILACMVAIHGDADWESGICIHATHFPSWGIYLNLKQILAEHLSLPCPIHIDNWIRFKTYGENRFGLARNHESVVLIDAGRKGVSAGILIQGRMYAGKHFLSGEIGHSIVDPNERDACACGSRGCLEQVLSCERLEREADNRRKDYPDSLLNRSQAAPDVTAILGAADLEDELARLLLSRVAGFFSLAISQIIMFFDPEIILIEGDYAAGCRFFEGEIERKMKEFSFPHLNRSSVLVFNNTESIPTLKGAAALAIDRYYENH